MAAADPHAQVEIDSTADSDSAYGDEVSQYTASITSSVYDFQIRNGRRYQSYRDGVYMLPNDDQENDRLDIHHALMRKALGDKLYWAPIGDNPPRVLDMGTGTGIWAIDFGDEHPGSQVIGNDLTPGPTEVPPNVSFYVDDIEDEWIYENDPFDFVHARFLASGIRDWPKLIRSAFTCTKPGGWIELQDWDLKPFSMDNTLTEDSAFMEWHRMTNDAREGAGFSMRPGKDLEQWIRDAGFVNVQAHKILIPMGAWPKDKRYKELGVYNLLQFEGGVEAVSLGTLMNIDPPWTHAQILEYVEKVKASVRDRRVHALFNFYVVFGQKPRPTSPSPPPPATTATTTTFEK